MLNFKQQKKNENRKKNGKEKQQTSPTECDLETEFQCKFGNIICIPRKYVNNNINDCLDGSDEMV